jgi:hypothetical protein
MTAPLSYLAAQEHVSDLARAAGERLISRKVPYRRVSRLSRVFAELRLRVAKETPSAEPARSARIVDAPGRPA